MEGSAGLMLASGQHGHLQQVRQKMVCIDDFHARNRDELMLQRSHSPPVPRVDPSKLIDQPSLGKQAFKQARVAPVPSCYPRNCMPVPHARCNVC